MNISLIANGLDSLSKGYNFLLEYENKVSSGSDENERYFILKDAILSIHHGVEIMMKAVLTKHSEFLLVSEINKHVKDAYLEVNQQGLNSIYESSKRMKVHTVTYVEAFERLKYICSYRFKKQFEEKILRLDEIRNIITHSEVFMNESEVINLFDGLINDIDVYFTKALGEEYNTLSGYSDLIKNSKEYQKVLLENGFALKARFIDSIQHILAEIEVSMGFDEVRRITDIDKVVRLFSALLDEGFRFGTDMYDGTCSGEVSRVSRCGKEHVALYMKDNNLETRIKLRSLIILLANPTSKLSPLIFLESDDDPETEKEHKNIIQEDYCGKNYVEALYFVEDNNLVYNPDEINEEYMNRDYVEGFVIRESYRMNQYTERCMFSFLNIQGLQYPHSLAKLIRDSVNETGETFEKKISRSLASN